MSRNIRTQGEFPLHTGELRTSFTNQRKQRYQRWKLEAWALLAGTLLAVLTACNADAWTSAEDTLDGATRLSAWEQRLTAEQRDVWQSLSAAKQRELLAKQDVRRQEGRVDLYRKDAQHAAAEAHQQRNINASLMRQLDARTPQQPQPKAPHGYDPGHSAVQNWQGSTVRTDTETSREWVVDRGVFRPIETTHNTYILPAPVVAPGKASMRHRITGNDFDSSLVIPEGTDADTLSTLQNATTNATERYKQKLSLLHEANVMQYNTGIYKAQTARATSILWALIPLLMCLSGCGLGIYIAVSHQRHERLRTENHIIDGRD